AYSRYVTRTAPYLGTEGMQPLAGDLDVELGYAYDSPAIRGASLPAHENPRHSKGRPGTRAPHVWIERDGARLSTLDLWGPGFTLLAGARGDGWCSSARQGAISAGIPIAIYQAGPDIGDPEGAIGDAFGIGDAGAVL